jgi:hypothetical protein
MASCKEHQVFAYTIEDFEKDLAGIREVREKQKAGRRDRHRRREPRCIPFGQTR